MSSPTPPPMHSPKPSDLLAAFEKRSGLIGLQSETKARPDGTVLVIFVANPTERLFAVLQQVQAELLGSSDGRLRATLKKRPAQNLLQTAEARLFLKTLSESLTINRHSFTDDFFGRYIKSVFAAEEQIVSSGNHVVFGRRGSGKSSLLLYAMHRRRNDDRPFAWIDMQVYAQRDDSAVTLDVVAEVVEQAAAVMKNGIAVEDVLKKLNALRETTPTAIEGRLRQLLPEIKRLFSSFALENSDFTIFLDDFHVLAPSLQPKLLQFLYSFVRGNRMALKLSAIESFTKLWEPSTRTGLEMPHDVQSIKLDYNLTMAEKATEHIRNILDAHAAYCGLPAVRSLCTENDVLSRLVWVAAGVPRDALNVFSQAMTKAAVKDQKRITVTNINVAASEMVNDKLRDIERDASGRFDDANNVLDQIRTFAIKDQKKNAFLVEILNDDPLYDSIRQLIDLRLLHVVHEGITRHEAGRKYVALILDYGFYIGVRAAKSVDLFNRGMRPAKYEELRDLPVFHLSAPLAGNPG